MVNDDFVVPPSSKKDETDFVSPPSSKKDEIDFVSPPSKKYDESNFRGHKNTENVKEKQSNNNWKSYFNGYFDTPKIPPSLVIPFYLTGYLLLGLLGVFVLWVDEEVSMFDKLFWTIVIPFSNYSFSWFSDYQRMKGGTFSWYFTRFGSGKLGLLYSASQNYQNVSVSKGWFGSYNVNSKNDWGKHFLALVMVTLIVETLKFIISLPIAIVSIFIHKKTISKYRELLKKMNNPD